MKNISLRSILNRKYQDEELIKMLFDTEKTETFAINYILRRNRFFVSKMILTNDGNQNDVNSILNDGLVILINNIREEKFKTDSSLHTYYIGICKLLWKRLRRKNALYLRRNDALDNYQEEGKLSELIEKFEKQDENSQRLEFIYSFVTEKCKIVLDLWARGFDMNEIKEKMGYKNSQIAMNKKNTCLKQMVRLIKSSKP